jgi:hypothetical protein
MAVSSLSDAMSFPCVQQTYRQYNGVSSGREAAGIASLRRQRAGGGCTREGSAGAKLDPGVLGAGVAGDGALFL